LLHPMFSKKGGRERKLFNTIKKKNHAVNNHLTSSATELQILIYAAYFGTNRNACANKQWEQKWVLWWFYRYLVYLEPLVYAIRVV